MSHRINTGLGAGLWACFAAALAFGAVLVATVLLNGEALYWQIAAGRWMIENQQVLRIDPFSFTYQGHAWEIRDWLSDILLALAYVGGGWSGVMVLTAAAAAGGAGLLAFYLARGRRGLIAAIWLGLALAVGAGASASQPYLLALPCAVAWIGGLTGAGRKAPPLKLLPVMLVWANLADGYLIGLALMLALAAEAIVFAASERLALARGWAVFAGLALLCSLLTPNGVIGFGHALAALSFDGPVSIWPLLVGLPAAALLAPQRRMVFRLVFLAIGFALALFQAEARLCFAVAAPLLAVAPAAGVEHRGLAWRPLAALVVLVLVASAIRIVVPLARTDDADAPRTALAAVPPGLKHQPVFNEPRFGGYLIAADVRPFIDGRPHYREAFRTRYGRGMSPDLLAATLARYHVRWTILAPDNPAIALMDGASGWHRLHTDPWAVIHVRDGH